VNKVFAGEVKRLTKGIEDSDDRSKRVKRFFDGLDLQATFTHRHYVQDSEYIPYGEDIEGFLKREIGKPIIRWNDSDQLGFEILPNKYFYRYQPPPPAKALLAEFWRLEKEAENMLEGLSQTA
jgi:type I restriction enzyme M protein